MGIPKRPVSKLSDANKVNLLAELLSEIRLPYLSLAWELQPPS